MDAYVCKFYSTQKIKSDNISNDKEWKRFGEHLNSLYLTMLKEFGLKGYTSDKVQYYIDQIMKSESKEKFEHSVSIALISKFTNIFNHLYYCNKTIEAVSHTVCLSKIGFFIFKEFEIEIRSESSEYTVRERLENKGNLERVKAEKGNTLIFGYRGTPVKYQTLIFDPSYVDVMIS